jgi:hypothetical protein
MKYVRWLPLLATFFLAYVVFAQGKHAQRIDADLARLAADRASEGAGDRTPGVVTVEREVRVETQPSGSAAPHAPTARAEKPPAPPSSADQEAFLASTFSSQPIDAAWSRGAARQISDILRPIAGKNTNVVSVDCRATLCRADLEHETDADFRAFMNAMFTGAGAGAWNGAGGGGKVETEPDGRVKAVLYFAKEGTELPTLS